MPRALRALLPGLLCLFSVFPSLAQSPTRHLAPVDKDFSDQPGSIIRRFVDPLTRQERRLYRSVLSSDTEHADSVAPVLTPDTPVYIHYDERVKDAHNSRNYILEEGRVFMNYECPFDPEKAPVLKIRPIDGGSKVPFLIRLQLTPREGRAINSSLDIDFRLPAIFSPQVDVRSVTSGNEALEFLVQPRPNCDDFNLRVNLPKTRGDSSTEGQAESLRLLIEGTIALKEYSTLPSQRFEKAPTEVDYPPPLRVTGRLLPDRDYRGAEERARIGEIVQSIQNAADSRYQQLVLAHRYASEQIRYYQNSMQRTPVQILTEGVGDCDDFCRVLIALLRAMGIPAKLTIGYLYDFNNMGPHGWVEAALPDKDGNLRWFICDPTLASVSPDKDYFVQFKNRIYLYPLRFNVAIHNLAADKQVEILLNWQEKEDRRQFPTTVLNFVLDSFTANLQDSLSTTAQTLRTGNLLVPREFRFALGSRYILADRAITENRTRLQLFLEGDESIALEIGVLDDEYDLSSEADRQTLELLKTVYQQLKDNPFQNTEAPYCLDLTYTRDSHSDRLQKVRLHICRYLVEQHFKRVLSLLEKQNLLNEPQAQRIQSLYDICSGKNLYYLQELARRLPHPPANELTSASPKQ